MGRSTAEPEAIVSFTTWRLWTVALRVLENVPTRGANGKWYHTPIQ
jgi:hypothetical protein